MKYLIMTEGKNEKGLLDVFIQRNIFVYPVNQLLDERKFHSRKIEGQIITLINTLPINEKINIIRVGDKFGNLKIPKIIKDRIVSVRNYCTKPEFEILLIINENLYDEYNKVKQKMKCKIFAKKYIKINNKKYDNSTEWVINYFKNTNIESCLKKYKKLRGRVHTRNELLLLDLIKTA